MLDMKPYLIASLVLLPRLVLAADRTPAPLPAEKAAATMVLPDGFRSTLFAGEPMVTQPVSFCTDSRGRLIVAEALNYGEWKPIGKDRIVILEDSDGDGKAETRKVFFEGFNYITGIEVGFGGVWVMSPPGLYFIPDRDRDDKPDSPPQLILDGFGHKESRHNLANGFTWGPDGWLYAGHGRTSPSLVGKPGTPAEQRILCDGGVYRVDPVSHTFQNFADGTTNPWGVDFDDFGECFVSNCVNPHLFHMIPGGHYEPWRNRPSSLYAYERIPTIADHLHFPSNKLKEMRGETPELLAMGGGHAHCGTLVYLGDRFPERYRNTVFMCNIHGRRINNDILHRKGSGYAASHGKDFMISADPWFMGVTLRTGPDGNLFVSDWSDTGECHTYKPETATGRIFKIHYGDPVPPHRDPELLTDAELVELQTHRNDWFVRQARRILHERSTQKGWNAEPVHQRLHAMLASGDLSTPQRLRALWTLHVTRGIRESQLVQLLSDPSEHLRAWAIRLLSEGTPDARWLKPFVELAHRDPSPVVRLNLASALQRLPIANRWEIAAGLLSHGEDSSDASLPLMIWYGIEPMVPQEIGRAMQLAASSPLPLLRRYIARRAADHLATSKDPEALASWVATVKASKVDVQLDLLTGVREGLRGRKSVPMPGAWPDLYRELQSSPNTQIRDQATGLAMLFGDPQAIETLLKVASNASSNPGERVQALEALIQTRSPRLATTLHQLLADPVTRRTALRGLTAFKHGDTPAKVLAIYNSLSSEEKTDAIAVLATSVTYASALLDALEKQRVPRTDVSSYIARQITNLGDSALTNRLRSVWGDIRESSAKRNEQLAKFQSQLTPAALRNADLKKGQALFTKACQQCHKLFGEGGTIGPDLTGTNRTNLEFLLMNLVDPSAEVARDYRMSIARLVDGRVVTGILLENSKNRVVLQTATDRVVLPPEDVESVKDTSQSIMPEGLLDGLSKTEVRDLIAFLGATK